MSLTEDQQYISKVINGDTQAFSVLVDRYKHMVYTLAFRMLKNKEEAEEVAQDSFLKAYMGLSDFKGDSKFSTWIYKIVYHRSLDYLKKRGRSIKTSTIDEYTEYYLKSVDDILYTIEQKERRAIIKNALDELSENDSILITLHYFEELSLKEISDIMNISVNTIKVRLFRSRKRLGEILKLRLAPEIIKDHGKK